MRKLFVNLLIMVLLFQASALSGVLHAAVLAEGMPAIDAEQSGNQILEFPAEALSVLYMNVGKADAILIQYEDKAFLIDTGSKASVPKVIGALNWFGVEKLDGIFLTHSHSDHVGGVDALARLFNVGELYSAVFSENKKNGKNKIEEIGQELSLFHRKLHAGERVPIAQNVFLDVLGPIVFNAEDDNDNSLVLKLSAHDRTFLFVGDMQFYGEGALLQSGVVVDADVLKVGNHGNPDATSEQFATAVSPDYSVISTNRIEDLDSANERVLHVLRKSTVYITENFSCGVLFHVNKDGTIHITDPMLTKALTGVAVTGVQRDTQTVTLTNNGPDIDISGYMILSQRGNELFVFPEGSLMYSGQTVSVSVKPGADFTWPDESKVWHQEKEDSALLFDRFGNLLSRWD